MIGQIIQSGMLSTVFATTGVAPPVILALIAYIGVSLKNVPLNPPLAISVAESLF